MLIQQGCRIQGEYIESKVYLYTLGKQLENEIVANSHTVLSKNIKQGKLMEDQQDLSTANQITLLKEMKDHKVERHTVFKDWETEYGHADQIWRT